MNYEQIGRQIEASERGVITTHRSPDGDALGSALGLALVLRKKGINAAVVVPNAFPDFLAWMSGADTIINFEDDPEKAQEVTEAASLIFCLDFNHLDRLEAYGKVVGNVKVPWILIDHHVAPADYFEQVLSDTSASSTCELVYRFFVGMGWTDAIDEDVANCLYTGIMTDTGSFRFSSTSAATHRVVADLMDKGLRAEVVHDRVFDTNHFERLQLLGYILSKKMVYHADLHTAVIPLSLREKNRFRYQKGDTEGVVNYGLSILGSRMSVFISEEDGYCKLSLRSKGDLDVNKIARTYFNGGGHKNAAGGRLMLPLDRALEEVERVLSHHQVELA